MSPLYVGRRKSAVALVRFVKGNGDFVINEKLGFDYLQQDPFAIQTVVAPLKLINLEKKYNIICLVRGGGVCAQAEAIQLGIARALCSLDASSSQNAVTSSSPSATASSSEETRMKSMVKGSKSTDQLQSSISPSLNAEEQTRSSASGKALELNSLEEKHESKNQTTRSLLKEQGYLRRDSRIKERRKYGLKKARKAEQYSKR